MVNKNQVNDDGHTKEEGKFSAEEKILNAAREVFMKKGFDGARMQEISEIAGINKALLHYYFRSKDKLFMAVFESVIRTLVPSLARIFAGEGTLSNKIRDFFNVHMGFLISNPMITKFIVTEMSKNPERFKVFFDKVKEMDIYSKFDHLIKKCISTGEINPIEPVQLLLNLISLSAFPVLAGPMIKELLDLSDKEYEKILESRKTAAADFTINSIISK